MCVAIFSESIEYGIYNNIKLRDTYFNKWNINIYLKDNALHDLKKFELDLTDFKRPLRESWELWEEKVIHLPENYWFTLLDFIFRYKENVELYK